jgi:hypothetical protein
MLCGGTCALCLSNRRSGLGVRDWGLRDSLLVGGVSGTWRQARNSRPDAIG